MRKLSDTFMNDLSTPEGILYPILQRIKNDHTLMLSIREDYINVYYRGGNILRLEALKNGSYNAFFNYNYHKSEPSITPLPTNIENLHTAKLWADSFQELKGIMDFYFSKHCKPEREFQQLVARENNYSTMANQSEYFISDIEFADSKLGARFDLLALRWLTSQRKSMDNCRAALIEMKYGEGALKGDAGLLKHLHDIEAYLSERKNHTNIIETVEVQFNQLDKLGLMTFNKPANWVEMKLDSNIKTEVIFILANQNPRSSQLLDIINDSKMYRYDNSPFFNLKFYISSFAGYALHSKNMINLWEFRKLLKNMHTHKMP